MILYRARDLQPARIAAGYIAAVVCDCADPGDSDFIDELIVAYENKRPARLKGQRFTVGEIDISTFFGTICFGLLSCQARPPANATPGPWLCF